MAPRSVVWNLRASCAVVQRSAVHPALVVSRQQGDEFLAAITRENTRTAGLPVEDFRHMDQSWSPIWCPEGIVHLLEQVNVKDQDRERMLVTNRILKFQIRRVEATAVEQPVSGSTWPVIRLPVERACVRALPGKLSFTSGKFACVP
ncbi:hypothetical protein [Candidatus Villigracilis saccharophilus]|uniref:hypothetical protein n=1 Tax=Candidatus Villigracilis saccharophilus TaxID=3140684 RepID=UPI0031F070A6